MMTGSWTLISLGVVFRSTEVTRRLVNETLETFKSKNKGRKGCEEIYAYLCERGRRGEKRIGPWGELEVDVGMQV